MIIMNAYRLTAEFNLVELVVRTQNPCLLFFDFAVVHSKGLMVFKAIVITKLSCFIREIAYDRIKQINQSLRNEFSEALKEFTIVFAYFFVFARKSRS